MAKSKASATAVSAAAKGSEKGSPIIRANINRQVVISPTFASLYANDTQIQTTPWDIRLIFGEIAEPPTEERPTVVITVLGQVRMSPQHAKLVAKLLVEQLEAYEKRVGPIPQP
jgi:hypothetical protein